LGQVYDRKLADIMLVQEDISRDIFENLRLKLNVEEKKHLEAYRLYLKGRNFWNKRTEEGWNRVLTVSNRQSSWIPPRAGVCGTSRLL